MWNFFPSPQFFASVFVGSLQQKGESLYRSSNKNSRPHWGSLFPFFFWSRLRSQYFQLTSVWGTEREKTRSSSRSFLAIVMLNLQRDETRSLSASSSQDFNCSLSQTVTTQTGHFRPYLQCVPLKILLRNENPLQYPNSGHFFHISFLMRRIYKNVDGFWVRGF